MAYLGCAALPASLMAHGHPDAGKLFYKGFTFLCHQYPWRSFFLYGEQPYYPLFPREGSDMLSIEEASGMPAESIRPREFYGTPRMGYKMAVCQRDTAIYAGMALFCAVFFLSGNRIRPMKLWVYVLLGLVPMAADGGSQMLSHVLPAVFPFRESTPLLRVITGALFGYFTCRYLFPKLERTLREGERSS